MLALRTVKLSGILGKEFGRVHKFAVSSPAEAIRALCANFPRFKQRIIDLSGKGIVYRVFIGTWQLPLRDNVDSLRMTTCRDITFAPCVSGAKRGGVLQTIVGIALIVAGASSGQTWLANIGISLTLGGAIQMLSPIPKSEGANERPDNKPSYVFDGAVNTLAQGNPVPVGYGRMIVGSAVISAGMFAEDIPV